MLHKKSLPFAVALVLGSGFVLAQTVVPPQPPRINQVMPPGGKAGTTFEVTVSGTDLDKATGLHFNFPGTKVEVVGDTTKAPPIDPKQKAAMKGPVATNVQKFKVTLPDKAPLGVQDVRIVTAGGVSNPRAFVVGDLQEVVEKEPNDDVPKGQLVELNTTVSGVIGSPTDVDYYLFSGKKGQRVVISCLTSSLDSRLHAQLQLYSAAGAFLSSNKGYNQTDALTDAVLPADGDYYVRLSSFAYIQGGPDYFYRLTISTTPWIDAVFPATLEPGKETKVTVFGRNLPGGVDAKATAEGRSLEMMTTTVQAPPAGPAQQRLQYSGQLPPTLAGLDGFELRLSNPAGASNPFFLQLARFPVVLDEGNNDDPEKGQKIPVPCEISGRFEKAADRDCYLFEATKGQVLSIELFGDRLGASHDLLFILRDAKGKVLTEQDDNPDILSFLLYARTEDPSRYKFTVPADGEYQLIVTSRDNYGFFGPRYYYTVRLGPEEADFRLVATPASLQPEGVLVNQASHQAYLVHALRLGGFTGDIVLSGDKLPPGVSVTPQVLSGQQKQGAFVVSAAPEAPPGVHNLKVVGTAVIDGKKVTREVRAGGITWGMVNPQANVPYVARLERELILGVMGKSPYNIAAEKTKISVLQGEKIVIPLQVNRLAGDFKQPVTVVGLSLPPGVVAQPLTLAADKNTGSITLDTKTPPPPGNYTVVLRGQTLDPKGKPPAKPGAGPPNIVQTAQPVELVIVPKDLAKLTVTPTAKIAAGKGGELAVKVARKFDYTGPFKLEVELPKGTKGITAEAATIAAREDDGKVTLQVAAGTPPGTNVVVTIRAVAMFNDIPVIHESKVTVAISK